MTVSTPEMDIKPAGNIPEVNDYRENWIIVYDKRFKYIPQTDGMWRKLGKYSPDNGDGWQQLDKTTANQAMAILYKNLPYIITDDHDMSSVPQIEEIGNYVFVTDPRLKKLNQGDQLILELNSYVDKFKFPRIGFVKKYTDEVLALLYRNLSYEISPTA